MKTEIGQVRRAGVFSSMAFLGVFLSPPSAYSAPVFIDDFEDGNSAGWLETATGNLLGSTGVELHNASQMAAVRDTGSGRYALSRDFGYVPDQTLSFTMHAIAESRILTGSSVLHSNSGVEISFLDLFNSSLGSVTITNATDPSSLGTNTVSVDTAQHDYVATMAAFAAQAGLGPAGPVSKISLNFFATANTFGNSAGVAHSSSTVWFDNVAIAPVPVPAAVWLLGTGLLGLMGMARKKSA